MVIYIWEEYKKEKYGIMVMKLDGKSVEYILWDRVFRGSICGIMQIIKHCKKKKWICKLHLNENLSEHG